MKVMVTGAAGMLGRDVMEALSARGYEAVGVDIAQMDITDGAACMRVIAACAPDAVIHCAAWTAVDAAETNEEACRRVNALGTEHIARACAQLGCKLMYISTDYVFDGTGERPWQPDDPTPAPLNVYGRTKLEGERAVRALCERFFIVRTAWVFGLHGKSFVRTMLSLGRTHDTLRVVRDQVGTPTYTRDLARLLADMIGTERYGVYHATNEGGYLSWYDFACEIFRQAGMQVRVLPVTTAEYGVPGAPRPLNSRLDRTKLPANGFAPLPPWQDALARFLCALKQGS